MQLIPYECFHLYNRSNNAEPIFREPENYGFPLKKYRHFLDGSLKTLAYCLMPTHFHCLIYVDTTGATALKQKIGRLLSSYTKAMHKRYQRHGSLFQQHTRTKHVDDERYLLQLAIYIHQNPVRAKLVAKQEEWILSSYRDYIGLRAGTLPAQQLVLDYFRSREAFQEFLEQMLTSIDSTYWIRVPGGGHQKTGGLHHEYIQI